MRPFVFKILNLNNHAIPVGKIPKYITDIIDSVEGFNIQGFSKIKVNGRSIIVDQIKIEPVTFSFSLLLIFKVITPPITYQVDPSRIKSAAIKLFSFIKKSSENKNTIPENPINNPIVFNKLNFSPFKKK